MSALILKSAVIFAHALVGWAYCGALVAVGRKLASMRTTLIVHAFGAPIGFAGIAAVYAAYFGYTGPLATAALFLGIVIALDVLVVALLVEKSFAMFRSPLGTWIPFCLIFAAVYLVVRLMS